MSCFDRFDICLAYEALEADFNVGGWLRERPSNQRRKESIGVQLHRMGFKSNSEGGSFSLLNNNAQEIYLGQVVKLGLPIDAELGAAITNCLCVLPSWR